MKMNRNRHGVRVLLLLAAGVHRHAVVAPAMLATLLAGTACGGDTAPGPQDARASWTLSEEPTVIIGGADEREGYLLHWVTGATRLGDGRIVVANESTSELKYYDPEGTHLFDVGGEGGGPGEFVGSLQRLARTPGDSVLVLSSRSGITRFGPDGRYASSSRYRLPPSGHCRTIEGRQRLVPDGSIVLGYGIFVGRGGECPPPKPGEARQPMVVGRFVPATEAFDTIAELPAYERTSDPETVRAYPRNRVYGIGHDRIYLGDTGSDTILATSFTGERIRVLPVPFEPVPVPADAKEELSREEVFTRPGQSMTLSWTLVYPDYYPRYARLVAAPEDRVWVMAYPPLKEPVVFAEEVIHPRIHRRLDGGALWRVVDRDGSPIAELRTPPGFFLLEVGDDYILGIHKDEFGREGVRLYGLTR